MRIKLTKDQVKGTNLKENQEIEVIMDEDELEETRFAANIADAIVNFAKKGKPLDNLAFDVGMNVAYAVNEFYGNNNAKTKSFIQNFIDGYKVQL